MIFRPPSRELRNSDSAMANISARALTRERSTRTASPVSGDGDRNVRQKVDTSDSAKTQEDGNDRSQYCMDSRVPSAEQA